MDTLRAARDQTQLRNTRRRAQRNVDRSESALDRFAAQDEPGRPYRRRSGLSYQLKKAYGDYEHSLERYEEAEAILEEWLAHTQDELRRYLSSLQLGSVLAQPSDIQLRPDGSTHVYYSTTGLPADYDHGHVNVSSIGKLAFIRTPGSRQNRKVGEAALVS